MHNLIRENESEEGRQHEIDRKQETRDVHPCVFELLQCARHVVHNLVRNLDLHSHVERLRGCEMPYRRDIGSEPRDRDHTDVPGIFPLMMEINISV